MATAVKNRLNGKAGTEEVVKLKPIDIREFTIGIRGTTPLVVHKFSEKAKKQIEDKQQKKAKVAREVRKPDEEFKNAVYLMPDSGPVLTKTAKYGIPAAGFKRAAIKACRYIDGIAMTFASGAFHVLDDAGGLVRIETPHPTMREDTVRLESGVLDLRYRPEFATWACKLRIKYNAACISPEQIVNLFHHAGFHVGWGEMRPEKGLSYGMFEVVTQ